MICVLPAQLSVFSPTRHSLCAGRSVKANLLACFSHFFTAVTLTHFMPFGVGAGVGLAFVPLPCPLCPPLQLNSRLMSAASPSTVIALACALITIVHLHYLMGWAAKKACLAAIRISQRGVS